MPDITNRESRQYSLGEIAQYLGAQLQGNADIVVSGIAPLDSADKNQISFLGKGMTQGSNSYKKFLLTTKAAAVILKLDDAKDCAVSTLIVNDPYISFARATALFKNAPTSAPSIHSSVIIGKNTIISDSVSIGAYSVIGDNVVIGKNSIIGSHCSIQNNCQLGENCNLYDRVTLYYASQLGNNVVIHSGVVIGADGFGFANEKGKWVKIFQLGKVIIGNNVDIGANTTIDRGALHNTEIGDDVIIDNLVQIAHNVKIGRGCAIAGCTGIGGSAKIGNYCMLGGAANINGHVEICDHVNIGGATSVYQSIDMPGTYVSFMNAQPVKEWSKSFAVYKKLPELAKKIKKIEKFSEHFCANDKNPLKQKWWKNLFKVK